MNLQGKTLAVVGAGGKIGRSVAQRAVAAGANVALIEHEPHALDEIRKVLPEGGGILHHLADITDPDSVHGMFATVEQRFGGLDGAVNSAYPRNASYGRPLPDVTYRDFCENVSAHLGGYFLFMQQCMKYSLARQRRFALVNLSSIYGVIAPRFEVYADTGMTMPVEYAAIKAGLQHMTRYVSAYAKGSGFRANCVSPGGILAGQDARFLARYNSYCRSKGMLDPNDVVPAVLFLLSDESEFVSGQNLIVDDGFTL